MSSLLVVTLEYWSRDVFSGNGVYGRTLIHALVRSGYRVGVLCCEPRTNKAGEASREDDFTSELLDVFPIQVETWTKTLDWTCCWREAVEKIKSNESLASWLTKLSPELVLPIDWSGVELCKPFIDKINIPMIFLNFRVYSANTNLESKSEEQQFYSMVERKAIEASKETLCLCKHDQIALQALCGSGNIKVLHPPIRDDILALALKYAKEKREREYLLLCCRLSPEKNVEVFFDVIQKLQSRIMKTGLKVFICGASCGDFGTKLKESLRHMDLDFETRDFLNAEELCDVFSRTRINFHPSLAEPYGMTIIEAAAFGAVTICNEENIGAVEVLGKENCVGTDMSDAVKVEESLRSLLDSEKQFPGLHKAAIRYDSSAFQLKLKEIIESFRA